MYDDNVFISLLIVNTLMSQEHIWWSSGSKALPRRMLKQLKYKMKRIPHQLEKIKQKEANNDPRKAQADERLQQQLESLDPHT
jgi:hypothetical protein